MFPEDGLWNGDLVPDLELVQNLAVQALSLHLHDLAVDADSDKVLYADGLLAGGGVRLIDVVERRAGTAAQGVEGGEARPSRLPDAFARFSRIAATAAQAAVRTP